MTNGRLFVLSGPSGVGKSTVVQEVMRRHPNLRFSVSVTTREKRPNEVDGENYYFVTREQFQQMLDRGELLEHAEYVGNCYGTPEGPIQQQLEQGFDILFTAQIHRGTALSAQMGRSRAILYSSMYVPPRTAVMRMRPSFSKPNFS